MSKSVLLSSIFLSRVSPKLGRQDENLIGGKGTEAPAVGASVGVWGMFPRKIILYLLELGPP